MSHLDTTEDFEKLTTEVQSWNLKMAVKSKGNKIDQTPSFSFYNQEVWRAVHQSFMALRIFKNLL